MKASKDLERFLDFLKSAESQLDQAMAGQQEAEAHPCTPGQCSSEERRAPALAQCSGDHRLDTALSVDF